MSLKLVKLISKEGENITQKNILYIDNELVSEVDWEEIDSFYNIKGIKYVCPRGPNYMYTYNNSKLKIEKYSYLDLEDWELKCFYHEKENFLFNFVLSKGNSDCEILAYNLDTYKWFNPKTFYGHIM